jgi:uncharacterized protein (DUF1800 family)
LAPYANNDITLAEAVHFEKRTGFRGRRASEFRSLGLNASVNLLMTNAAGNALDPQIEADAILYADMEDPCLGEHPIATNHIEAGRYLYYIVVHDDPNPLRWKLFYFWHDRFATSVRGLNQNGKRSWPIRHMYLLADNATMPDYRQFLKDFTEDPVELTWLNGFQNVYNANLPANENYAREFWELFTLGETRPYFPGVPNYTEPDIKGAARALTGYDMMDDPNSCDPPRYRTSFFNSSKHDPGNDMTFFGLPQANYLPLDVVDKTLDVKSIEAAEYITNALFEHFIGVSPTQNQLTTMVAAIGGYPTGNWDLSPVIDMILRSEAMFSPTARAARVRTPVEVVLGFLRMTDWPVSDTFPDITINEIQNELSQLGHELLNPPAVNGWSEGPQWINQAAVLDRQRAINLITQRWLAHPNFDLSAFAPANPDRNDAATYLMNLCRITGVDPARLNPTLFDAWVTYLNTATGGGTEYFDFSDLKHQRTRGLGAVWHAYSLSLDQAK